jgi:type II secretory pathway pseudopilin PulG
MKLKRSNSGITIVELIVVILIIGIMSAAAIPNIATMVELIKLRTAANSVKRQLIVARTRALSDPNTHVGFGIMDSVKTCVFFDTISPASNKRDAADPFYLGVNKLPKNIKLVIPASGGFVDSVVIFRGDGSAKYGGAVQVVNRFGKKRTVNVLPSTGRVKVQ